MILFSIIFVTILLLTCIWGHIVPEIHCDKLKSLGFVFLMASVIYLIGFGSWEYLFFKHLLIYSIFILSFSAMYNRQLVSTGYDLFTLITLFNVVQLFQFAIYRLSHPTYSAFINSLNCYKHVLLLNALLIALTLLVYHFEKPLTFLKRFRQLCEADLGFTVNVFFVSTLIKYKFFYFKETFWSSYFVMFGIAMILFIFLLDSGIKRQQKINFDKKNQVYLHYYDVLIELLEQSRKQQHEFKNHLDVIATLGKSKEFISLERYVTKLTNVTSLNMHEFLLIDNKILAALIYSKHEKAKKLGIEFAFSIDNAVKMPLDDHEFVEVIGNLTENAFESLSDTHAHHKKVVLEIKKDAHGIMIQAINTPNTLSPEHLQHIFDIGYSTKNAHRGYGLAIVKEHVSRYKGKVQVHISDKSTVFSILFEK